MAQEKQIVYATISERMFAAVIDLSLLYFLVVPISAFLYPLILGDGDILQDAIKLALEKQPDLAKQKGDVLKFVLENNPEITFQIYRQYLSELAVQFVLIGLVVVPFLHLKGQTIGKMVAGVKVVDAITFQKMSLAQTIIRYIGYVPVIATFGIGLFTAGLSKRRRGWHDVLADSVVIMDEKRWYKILWDRLLGRG